MRVFRQKDGKHGGCVSFSPHRGKCREATIGDIFGACEASDKPSGGIRNACLSSERRQAWRMCILFPPSGEMSRSDNRGYLRSLQSKRHRISGASGMRVFRQKDGKHGGCVSFSPRRGKWDQFKK
jgi:hypothetical protein